MIIIRAIKKEDTEIFIKLAFTANIGMTSLPKNHDLLERKIVDSEKAFQSLGDHFEGANYLFVLEDLTTGAIGGTCGINSDFEHNQNKYFYSIETIQRESSYLPAPQSIPIMKAYKYSKPSSEICSLYLFPEFRKEGLGRLLSLSRFLFAALDLRRFKSTIFAELRAYVDKNQNCPFWDGVGRNFLDIDYEELIELRNSGNFDTQQVIPEYPIYTSLLPIEVQEAIGKIHPNTWPAFNMLSQEGFYPTNEYDVFDAGPFMQATTNEIRTIKTSIQDVVSEITRNQIDSSKFIISNNRVDFRSCYSTLQKVSKGISISTDVAEALKLKIGDTLRYSTPATDTQHSNRPLA